MVNNSTPINKNPSHLNSLNDGQQFPQYQQKSPLDIGGIVDHHSMS
jgi:hypothetical protein